MKCKRLIKKRKEKRKTWTLHHPKAPCKENKTKQSRRDLIPNCTYINLKRKVRLYRGQRYIALFRNFAAVIHGTSKLCTFRFACPKPNMKLKSIREQNKKRRYFKTVTCRPCLHCQFMRSFLLFLFTYMPVLLAFCRKHPLKSSS